MIDNFTPADRLIALAALTVISKPDPGKLLDIEVIAIQKIKDDFFANHLKPTSSLPSIETTSLCPVAIPRL